MSAPRHIESLPMSPRRSFHSAPTRRSLAPRCHGGASSLLRLASATLPQRAVEARASGWRELDDTSAGVEHVVRRPLCAPGATLWS
jgi:hypothetical protein